MPGINDWLKKASGDVKLAIKSIGLKNNFTDLTLYVIFQLLIS